MGRGSFLWTSYGRSPTSAARWAAQHHPRRVTQRRPSLIVRVVDTFESIAGRRRNPLHLL
jgi:hypothetical protein